MNLTFTKNLSTVAEVFNQSYTWEQKIVCTAMKEEFKNLVESGLAVCRKRKNRKPISINSLPPLPGSYSSPCALGMCKSKEEGGKPTQQRTPSVGVPLILGVTCWVIWQLGKWKLGASCLRFLGTRAPQAMFRSFPFWKIPIPSNQNDSAPQESHSVQHI